MRFETDRLILRPWSEEDAESLFEYAKDPAVGPIAGWPVHTSVDNSREIIKGVLSADETYAVCLKEDNRAIGSVGLIPPAQSQTKAADDEIEIGYWIGVPFWGKGLIPEAVRKLQEHVFLDLGCSAMWCGYYDGNEKSKRCQEKCGFTYHHTEENKPCVLMGDVRTEHFTRITKDEFLRSMVENKDFGIGHMGDSMKQVMNRKTAKNIVILISVNIVFITLTVVFAVLHHIYHQGWMSSVYITFLTISYHFSMRLIVGETVTVIYRNREFNLDSVGFRIHSFEKDLYRRLNVKKWKLHMITAKPEQFDLRENSMDDLLHNMAQAELVHRIIMVLSFAPILLIIPYGAPMVFIVTSIIAALIDLQFVIIQRYNRPRVMKLLKKKTLDN